MYMYMKGRSNVSCIGMQVYFTGLLELIALDMSGSHIVALYKLTSHKTAQTAQGCIKYVSMHLKGKALLCLWLASKDYLLDMSVWIP